VLALALLLPGCAWLPFGRSDSPAFDAAAQGRLLRERAQQGAAAEAAARTAPRSVEERLRKGDALRDEGAYAAAMWSYLQAHELDPDHPAPVARMGSLHLMVDPGRAESIFRELVEQHPENGAAHTGLGLVRIAREDWPGAHAALTRALELSPDSAAAHSALGVCLDRLGEHAAAQAAYTRATTLQPRFYAALNNLGVSHLTAGEFEQAAAVLHRASLLEDRDAAVFNNLGVALGRVGRYDEALAAFRHAGSEQAARNNLGYVAYLSGDYERALAEYERALLASGDQRLLVLRNLRVARQAGSEAAVSAASPPR
jgi:Flp pilus assembly protein TadD